MYKHIVAGTDLSTTAGYATERASVLAKGLGAELTLVHAGEDPGDPFADLGKRYGADTIATPGPAADVLVNESARVGGDLLVVGSVGMSGAKRFLLGNVPNKVSHHAPIDLLIVKTDPPPREIAPYKKLLVGTDGSPTATRAVEAAAGLAAMLDVTPVIVCAYEAPTEHELEQMRADSSDAIALWKAGSTVRSTPEEFKWRIAGASQAEDVLERAADHATKHGAEAEVRAIEGNAAEVLISLAEKEGFDVIVVGSVGMSGAKRFMLGNVPHRVSHHAPTDVLILHTS
jgi:nucleotide-binding universal stress UspA family protein